MKKLFILILALCHNTIYAQNYLIEYSQKYDPANSCTFILTISDSISWYKFIPEPGDKVKDKLFLKKYAQKFLFYKESAPGKAFYIKDTLHQMQWKLTNEKKTILGYNCNSAKTSFRGRNFTAYYAPKIAVADGPWKFGGLPGLILEVASDEGFIKFMALNLNKINITEKAPTTNNHTFISWDAFKQGYKKANDNYMQIMKTSENNIKNNVHGFLKVESIESIYKELEEGQGLAY